MSSRCSRTHQGEGSFQYIKGRPGLIYAIRSGGAQITSGTDTWWRPCTGYKSGDIEKITVQIGFGWEYDARAQDAWRDAAYVMDESWRQVSDRECKGAQSRGLSPRPVKKLAIGERVTSHIVAQGVFIRRSTDDAPVGLKMQRDFLSALAPAQMFTGPDRHFPSETGIKLDVSHTRDADGVYLIVDLGREEVGLLHFDVDAAAGAVMDIAWGEHLDDLRVRAHTGGRNFATRYICRGGRQVFTHPFTRIAGRYIQLHLSNMSSDVTVHYAGLLCVEYPVTRRKMPVFLDSIHRQIYETSVRTLRVCMHEHYEDCPWREQALYAMDMRSQALAGYYCFGEYDFPAASLDLLAKSLKADGYLESVRARGDSHNHTRFHFRLGARHSRSLSAQRQCRRGGEAISRCQECYRQPYKIGWRWSAAVAGRRPILALL